MAELQVITPPMSEAEFGANALIEAQAPEPPLPEDPIQNAETPWNFANVPEGHPMSIIQIRVLSKWMKQAYYDFLYVRPPTPWPSESQDVLCRPLKLDTDILRWAIFQEAEVGTLYEYSEEVVIRFSLASQRIYRELTVLRAEMDAYGYQLSGENQPYDAFETAGLPVILPITHGVGMAEFLGMPEGYLDTARVQSKRIQLWLNLMPVMLRLLAARIDSSQFLRFKRNDFWGSPVCVSLYEWHRHYLAEMYPNAQS